MDTKDRIAHQLGKLARRCLGWILGWMNGAVQKVVANSFAAAAAPRWLTWLKRLEFHRTRLFQS